MDIPAPDNGPFWEYPAEWDFFRAACYSKAGFADPFPVYLPGSSFCSIQDISDNNLKKLVRDHTKEMRDGKYAREQASAFFGGYVLKIDGKDKYFPQRCGDLSDIQHWQKLLVGGETFFYQGHPGPMVTVREDLVILDFSTEEFEEHFIPPVKDNKLELNRTDLANAVDSVKIQLKTFAERLVAIDAIEQLGIHEIDKLLVWGDDTNA